MAADRVQLNAEIKLTANELQQALNQLKTGGVEAARELARVLGQDVTKKLFIETRVDPSGGKKLVAVQRESLGVVDQLVTLNKKANSVQSGSVTSLRQQVNQAKQLRDQTAKYQNTIDPLGNSVRTINDQWVKQNQRLSQVQRSLDLASASGFWDKAKTGLRVQGLFNFANGLTEITAGFQAASIIVGQFFGSINDLVNSLAKLQQFSLAFKAIGTGATGGSLALQESSRIALNLGVSLDTVRQGFQQLSPVILASGGNIDNVSSIVETLSSRFAAFGISGDRARRVTNGIIQAFAKGKLQAEELTQQISEADPAFKTDFAAALGVSVAELEKLVKAGKITTDVLIKTLPELSKSSLLYGKLGVSASDAVKALRAGTVTIDQARNKLQTLNQLSFERLAKGFEPLLVSFIDIGASVTGFFDRISKLNSLETIGNIAGAIGQQLAKLIDTLLRVAEIFISIADAANSLTFGLAGIPIVSQAIGAAILLKLAAPLAVFKDNLVAAGMKTTGFTKTLAGLSSFSTIGQTFRSIGKGAEETTKKIDGIAKVQGQLSNSSNVLTQKISNVSSSLQTYQRAADKIRVYGPLPAPAAGQLAYLENAITRTKLKLAEYTRALDAVGNKQNQLTARSAALTASLTRGFNPLGLLNKGFLGLGGAIRGVVSALGPLGLALIAITTLQSAVSNGLSAYNTILNDSKERSKVLSQAITDLGGDSSKSEQPITGLALAWERFSAVAGRAVINLGKLFNGDQSADLEKNKKALNENTVQAGRFLAILGAFTLAGAAVGATLGGINAATGAAIGAVIGLVVGLAASGDDASVKLEKLKKTIEGLNGAVAQEGAQILNLQAQLKAAGEEVQALTAQQKKLDDAVKQKTDNKAPNADLEKAINAASENQQKLNQKTKEADAAYVVSARSVREISKQFDDLVKTQKIVKEQANQFSSAVKKAAAAPFVVNKLLREQFDIIEKIRVLQKKGRDPATTQQIKELGNQWSEIRKKIEVAKKAETARPRGVGREQFDADIKKYLELQNTLSVLNPAIASTGKEVNKLKTGQDAASKATGKLTEAQKLLIPTISTTEENIKTRQTILENEVNPNLNTIEWVRVNREIAKSKVELQALKDGAEGLQSLESAIQIRIRINSGELVNSVSNAKRVVDNLENASALIDINAPELPMLISKLSEAKQSLEDISAKRTIITIETIEKGIKSGKLSESYDNLSEKAKLLEGLTGIIDIKYPQLPGLLDKLASAQEEVSALDGKRATVTVQVLEQRLTSGGPRTQEALARITAAQRNVVQNTPTTSSRYDLELEKLKEFEQREKAAALSTDELRRKLAENNTASIQDAIQLQMDGIKLADDATRASYDKKKQAIQEEIRLIEERYNKEIARLRELTPAEEKLKALRARDLQQASRQGGRAGLEARAELERLQANEQIAELEKKQSEEKQAKEKQLQEIEKQRQAQAEAIAAIEAETAQVKYQTAQAEFKQKQEERDKESKAIQEELTARENSKKLATEANQNVINASETVRDVFLASMEKAAEQAQKIRDLLTEISGKTITVFLKQVPIVPGRWSGGPVSAGQVYKVNELGREGFISNSGRVSEINKPRNASWRPPSSGYVIPAHIWSSTDAPTGIQANRTANASSITAANPNQRLINFLLANTRNTQDTAVASSIDRLSEIQARQAVQLGKLSHAVSQFNEKDWNVRVNVTPKDSNGYLGMINRAI
jgi:hypothetical protein